MKLVNLKEYRKAPLGAEFSADSVKSFLADEENTELLRTHIAVDNKDFVIAKYSFDNHNLLFALVNRVDANDVAGYLIIKKNGNYWQVQDTAIYKNYRNKGAGTDLYAKIIQHGYPLMNGYSLSTDAEKLWLERLPKIAKVSVLDLMTGKLEPVSIKPCTDNKSDLGQRWFFVAESSSELPGPVLENYSDGLSNLKYENWLQNRGRQTQSYRCTRIAGVGDF